MRGNDQSLLPCRAEVHVPDPVFAAWVDVAERMDFSVNRSAGSYAAYDGRGSITVSDDAGLDPDDSPGALVLHELAHFLTQGDAARHLPDWGLNTWDPGPEDDRRERSALRVQRALLLPWGLQTRLAPTTEYRPFYDALGDRPLTGDTIALDAWSRAEEAGRLAILELALRITAQTPDCGACGACCHGGFDVLQVERDDPFTSRRELLEPAPDGEGWELPRPSGFCPLVVMDAGNRSWRCSEYGTRPRGCARFTPGSDDCAAARRRAGVSIDGAV